MKASHEMMKETFALTHDKVDVGSANDVQNGDLVMFKDTAADKTVIGLPGQIRNIRKGKLDVYVGSSLRTEVPPQELVKLVARS